MVTTLTKQPNGTIELTLNVPWTNIETTYQKILASLRSEVELPGFRKGKAPNDLADKSINKTHVFEDVLRELLPTLYNEAITTQKIKPVITPKVELIQATEGKDWVIKAYTCEKPTVTLGDYKKAIVEAKAHTHKKLWVPGEEPAKESAKEDNKPNLEAILKALYESVTVPLPELLVEHEVNRLLSELIDQTKKLGLTVEQYLTSTQRTGDSIKKEYEEQARRTLTLEFALESVADKEGILVSDDDIDAIIRTAKSDEEKKALEKERHYLASVLRRQKTLDRLSTL